MVLPPFSQMQKLRLGDVTGSTSLEAEPPRAPVPREEVLGFHMPADVALAVAGVAAGPGNRSLLLHLKEAGHRVQAFTEWPVWRFPDGPEV